MGFALRHVSVGLVTALFGAGLVVSTATAGSASAAGLPDDCTWTIKVQPVPAGMSDFWTTGVGGQYFVGTGARIDGGKHPLLWGEGTVTELGSPNDDKAIAMDVNSHGAVVVEDEITNRPYLWVQGKIVMLAVPTGATSTGVSAINDSGTIVGTAVIDGANHAIVWSAGSPKRYRDLGTGAGSLLLNGVSNSGTIVANTSADEFYSRHGLKGTVAGGLSPLAGLDDTQDSSMLAASGSYVLGWGTPAGATDATSILWNGDVPAALPKTSDFGGVDVNRSGVVAGSATAQFGSVTTGQAAVWDGQHVTVLPNILPQGASGASAVTEDGTIVGNSASTTTELGEYLPVTWTCL